VDKQTKAALIKAVCAVTSDSYTLAIAKWWEMTPNGRAAAHLDQYLEGRGDLKVDLARLLQDDQAVQFKVHSGRERRREPFRFLRALTATRTGSSRSGR